MGALMMFSILIFADWNEVHTARGFVWLLPLFARVNVLLTEFLVNNEKLMKNYYELRKIDVDLTGSRAATIASCVKCILTISSRHRGS